MPKEKKQEEDGSIVNFYNELPKEIVPKYNNPNYDKIKIKHPMIAGIYGGSGSMKTNTLMNILKKMPKTWEKMVICVKTASEPFYMWLQSKIPTNQLEIYEHGIVPDVEKYKDYDGQMVIIFDDLVGMKNQKPIEEWFVRGRKSCRGKGCSMIYISQSYFRTPKLVRIQQNYIFLKRLTSARDLNIVINDFGMLGKKQDIIDAYKKTVDSSKENFFMIRVEGEPGERFSRNFLNFFDFDK